MGKPRTVGSQDWQSGTSINSSDGFQSVSDAFAFYKKVLETEANRASQPVLGTKKLNKSECAEKRSWFYATVNNEDAIHQALRKWVGLGANDNDDALSGVRSLADSWDNITDSYVAARDADTPVGQLMHGALMVAKFLAFLVDSGLAAAATLAGAGIGIVKGAHDAAAYAAAFIEKIPSLSSEAIKGTDSPFLALGKFVAKVLTAAAFFLACIIPTVAASAAMYAGRACNLFREVALVDTMASKASGLINSEGMTKSKMM